MTGRLLANLDRRTSILLHKVTLPAVLVVCSCPLLRTASFFRLFFEPSLPRSWDGAAHLAASSLYDRTIFPNTFGWTDAWFAGMPLPNFYPPLFYWCVAALHHAGLLLLLAFKSMVAIPFVLIPSALGLLSWRLSSRNMLTTSCTVLIACFPLLDSRLQSNFPGGLSCASTFNEGLYTQPLGFILLVMWIAIYLGTINSWRGCGLASLALASVVLASFFSAVAALPFGIVGLLYDLYKTGHRAVPNRLGARVPLPLKALTLGCGALLCAFWAVPVIVEYPYLVARPLHVLWTNVIPPGPWFWIWLGAALAGVILMFRVGSRGARTFVIGSVCLALLTLAPLSQIQWIPSQPPRLLSTLTFLLTVPVGWLLATLVRSFVELLCRGRQQRKLWFIATVAGIAAIITWHIKLPTLSEALYTGDPSITSVLDFGRTHQDGRYIVENAWQHTDQRDSRALNAYLGMQGNETLNVVFHEASPSSIYFTPLVNALSASSDSFGVSSALANDLDFYNQSLDRHLCRARQVGVRYIACLTPWIKRRFRQQAQLIEHNLGRWSVFEMKAPPAPEVEILRYLPALVVSTLDFKERQSGSYSFVRLSEEQFNSGGSDVLLVQAETNKIDDLSNLDAFGALILERYDYSDENTAFDAVRRFAQHRLLVLMSSGQPLFARLSSHLSELPHAVIVHREAETQSEWLNRSSPWLDLDQSRIRMEWELVERAMENSKISSSSSSSGSSQASISLENASFSVRIPDTNGRKVPVLIRTSFHPDWVRPDGERIYPVNPFFMLTFASGPFTAGFCRTTTERAAAVVSAIALVALVVAIIVGNRTSRSPTRRRAIRASIAGADSAAFLCGHRRVHMDRDLSERVQRKWC